MLNVYYYTAIWCGPCKQFGPIMDNVSTMGTGANIYKIDVDQDREMVTQHNVRSVPTLVFVKNGTEVDRFIGVQSQEKVLQTIKSYL